jgi:4-hydroxybenzoate polyprenyltransferase
MKNYLNLVTFSHTIFAMPFALVGGSLGFKEKNFFELKILLLIIGCMITARNAAMAFNRYIDRFFDEKNDRTKIREIPSGLISPKNALIFVIFNSLTFIIFTYFINDLCFYLSPVALLVILGYSYTKRFTPLCHLILGIGLGLAPVGAYLAVTNYFSFPIIILGFSVVFWVGGFDIIYALQDTEFDRIHGLWSIPSWLGKNLALKLSIFLHVISASLIIIFGYLINAGLFFYFASILFIVLLIYQHTLVKPNDLSKINLAFFTTNGLGSLIFGALTILDILLK